MVPRIRGRTVTRPAPGRPLSLIISRCGKRRGGSGFRGALWQLWLPASTRKALSTATLGRTCSVGFGCFAGEGWRGVLRAVVVVAPWLVSGGSRWWWRLSWSAEGPDGGALGVAVFEGG